MPTQQLQLVGILEPEFEQAFERLYYDHGSGNQESELVGHSQGTQAYKYVYLAPDRGTHTVNDPENGNTATTWIKYLKAFHRYRMVDGAAFNVVDQLTEATVLVMFSNESAYKIRWIMKGRKVYGVELYLKQYRAP